MRQLFVILLSLLYLIMSSGFTQYTHECSGTAIRLVSLSSSDNGNNPCSICQAKERGLKKAKKDCCKHGSETIKVDVTTSGNAISDLGFKLFAHIFPERMLGAVFDVNIESEVLSNPLNYSTKPPQWSNPLYMLNCVYRI